MRVRVRSHLRSEVAHRATQCVPALLVRGRVRGRGRVRVRVRAY